MVDTKAATTRTLPYLRGDSPFECSRIGNFLIQPFKRGFSSMVARKRAHQHTTAGQPYAWLSDGLCPTVKRIREGSGRWPALDAIYNWSPSGPPLVRWMEGIWLNIRNAQAVRNRYRIVVQQLGLEIDRVLRSRSGDVQVVSIACGSTQAVMEAVAHCGDPKRVKILCLDRDETALAYTRSLAERWELADRLETRNINLLTLIVKPKKDLVGVADVIEMVGLLDYFVEEPMMQIVQTVRAMLKPGGLLVTAHIHHNEEEALLEECLDWARMEFKTREQFAKLLALAGFPALSVSLITEPHRIHTVAVCRRHED